MSFLLLIPLVIVLTVIAPALLAWLWNMTIPLAFSGGREIGYWVAFRLMLIGALLSGASFISFKINLG